MMGVRVGDVGNGKGWVGEIMGVRVGDVDNARVREVIKQTWVMVGAG